MKTAESAATFVPDSTDLKKLAEASKKCRGCDLYRDATQTVFGEGKSKARVIMLGEQPGDQEDKQGKPFVGPAGGLLNKALVDAGIVRDDVYISNVVKHFRFIRKGKIRFHQKPSSKHIRACRPWLEAEVKAIQPDVIVCLGASAAQSILGRAVTIRDMRGKLVPHDLAKHLLVTVHPSSILRSQTDEERAQNYRAFVDDLKQVKKGLE